MSNNLLRLWHTYIISTVVTSSILAMMYVICLVRIYQGSRIPFIITLCVLLFLSNVGAAFLTLANTRINQKMTAHAEGEDVSAFWLTIMFQMICEILRDGCFNAAQWIFAFEYFVSATSIPYIFSKKDVPHSTIVRNKVIFWSILCFNCSSPCIFACLLGYGNSYDFKTKE